MLLKIKNIIVKIWPLSALQKKINLLSDELFRMNEYQKLLEERIEHADERIAYCEERIKELNLDKEKLQNKYNLSIKDIEKEILKREMLDREYVVKVEEEIREKGNLQKELDEKEKKLIEFQSEIERLEKLTQVMKSMESNIDSGNFWNDLYKNNGNSGTGSYHRLAEFKAEIVNKFLQEKNIVTAIEFGCGDGNQLSLINYNYYVGVDVSAVIIDKNKKIHDQNSKRSFYCTLTERDKYINESYDLSISMDVIFHLIEDDVFSEYMEDLFNVSNKYVIIYSSNHEEYTRWPEFRHRSFIGYIQKHIIGWKLVEFIPNRYPYIMGQEETTSTSDFYIFKKE